MAEIHRPFFHLPVDRLDESSYDILISTMERAHTIVMGIVRNMSLVFVNFDEEYKEERSNMTSD